MGFSQAAKALCEAFLQCLWCDLGYLPTEPVLALCAQALCVGKYPVLAERSNPGAGAQGGSKYLHPWMCPGSAG